MTRYNGNNVFGVSFNLYGYEDIDFEEPEEPHMPEYMGGSYDPSDIYGTVIEFDADYLLVIQADENLISGQIGYRHIELINVRMA